MIPAAIVGLAPTRRARRAVIAVGVLSGIPMFIGGALAGVPVIAVAAIALLGIATALLAARSRIGLIAMTLSLPMVGIGLSFADAGRGGRRGTADRGGLAVRLAGLDAVARTRARGSGRARSEPLPPTLGYGVRLGAAGPRRGDRVPARPRARRLGMCRRVVGHAPRRRDAATQERGPDPGRPDRSARRDRIVRLSPAAAGYSLATLAAVAGAAGTHKSRWYVTSAFTTFVVFLLLIHSHPHDAGSRFTERVGETLLGVGLAYFFGVAVPAVARRRRP